MELLFWILVSIGAFLCFSYFLLIASYCYAWNQMNDSNLVLNTSVEVSIIIAARNEEMNLKKCLDAILSQNYPKEKLEILVVDDHSDDSTLEIIRSYSEKNSCIKCLALPENVVGKKQAIALAVATSRGELIVTTDADCVMGTNWLSSIVSFYKKTEAKMIVAPVAFHNENSVFEKMQSLEFMALISSGGASLYFKKAIMCNGANLAFTKEVFAEVKGLDEKDKKASGDDVLLMYKINNQYPGKVHFLKNEEAIVYTKAKETVGQFAKQRKRWASKGFFALNAETKRVSVLIYLFNAYLVFVPAIGAFYLAYSPFYGLFIGICLILLGIKCFIDFLLLFLSASFFDKKAFLIFFLPEQIIYMIYVVVVGLLGSIGKYEWKGRKTN